MFNISQDDSHSNPMVLYTKLRRDLHMVHDCKFILLVVVTLAMSTTSLDPNTNERSKGEGDQEGCQNEGNCSPSMDTSQCADAPSAHSNAIVLYR